jgi:hypothetical protein
MALLNRRSAFWFTCAKVMVLSSVSATVATRLNPYLKGRGRAKEGEKPRLKVLPGRSLQHSSNDG